MAKVNKLLIIYWAVAITWIYVGSLVNFHQNRIWNKPLIPAALLTQPEKKRGVLSFSSAEGNTVVSIEKFFKSPALPEYTESLIPGYSYYSSYHSLLSCRQLQEPATGIHQLRAPPVA